MEIVTCLRKYGEWARFRLPDWDDPDAYQVIWIPDLDDKYETGKEYALTIEPLQGPGENDESDS